MARQERMPLIDPVKLEDHEVNALPGQYMVDTVSPKKIKIYTDAEYLQIKAQIAEMDQERRTHIIERVVNTRMAALLLERDHVMNHGRYCLEKDMSKYMHIVEGAKQARENALNQSSPVGNIDLSEFDKGATKQEPMQPLDLTEFDLSPGERGAKSKIPNTKYDANRTPQQTKSATPKKKK